ncbi:MAG: prepilin peptidase [Bacillota bacterium]
MGDPWLLFCFFLLGLVMGSFYNVCIYRLPRGQSLLFPSSHCPSCGRRLLPAELVPVFSYLWQKGRCRQCRTRISPRYLLVELLTGVLFAAVYIKYGLTVLSVKYIFLFSLLLVISFIDLDYQYIISTHLYWGLAGALFFQLISREHNWPGLLLGSFVSGGFLLLLYLISRGGMGQGDIELAAIIGLYLGWPATPLALILAFTLGGLAGLFLVVRKHKKRKDKLAFAPFLSLGTVLAVFAGRPLVNWYGSQFLAMPHLYEWLAK